MSEVDPFAREVLDRYEEVKSLHGDRLARNKQIADWIIPRRSFDVDGSDVGYKRRLHDIKGMVVMERLSAMLFGYLMSPHSPNEQPKLLERDAKTYEEDEWLDFVSRRNHQWYNSASGTYRTAMAEDMTDMVHFGASVLHRRKTKTGPIYISVPEGQCFWSENENGEIDEIYRVYSMRLDRAAARWPGSSKLSELIEKNENNLSLKVEILHGVQPRADGVVGSVRDRKPFLDVNILIEGSEVLETGGHDKFPFDVGRMAKHSGSVYGEGVGWRILPIVRAVNAVSESWVRNAQKEADPALYTTLPRGTQIDRRPGRVNHFNQLLHQSFGRQSERLIHRIEEGGNVQISIQLIEKYHRAIEEAAYVDWMMPGEGPTKTATEVMDLRDIRMRTMGPIVARLEHEKLQSITEGTFEDLYDIGYYGNMPESLRGELIGFEYVGPLAQAQRSQDAENIIRLLQAADLVAARDPDINMIFETERMVRQMADTYGVSATNLVSHQEFQEARQSRQAQNDLQTEMAAMQAGATAIRDGAQGLASLSNSQEQVA